MRSTKRSTSSIIKKAYIVKRKSKKYYYTKIIFTDGRISFYSLKTTNKTEALKNLNIIISRIDDSQNKIDAFVSYKRIDDPEKIVEQYLEYRKYLIQPSSLVKEKSILKQFLQYFKQKNLEYIATDDLYQYRKFLIRKGKKPKYINNQVSVINNFYKYLIDENIVKGNIVTPGKFYLKNNRKINFVLFNKTIIKDLMNEFDKLPVKFKAFFYILLFTGLRISEVRGLNRNYIYLDKKYILVVASKTYDDKKIKPFTKTKDGIRKVPILFDFLIPIIKEYLEINKEPYPFEKTSYTYLRELKNRICKNINLYFRVYDLRHGFASMLIDMGLNIKKVQYIMGHADIQTTLNIYSHLMDLDFIDDRKIANKYFDN